MEALSWNLKTGTSADKVINEFPLSQPPLPLVFYKWQGNPAQTGLEEVWARQVGALLVQTPTQVLPSQPSCPCCENQTSEIGGTPRSRPDGAWQKYHWGGVVPGCTGHRTPSPALNWACYRVPGPLKVLLLWGGFIPTVSDPKLSILPPPHMARGIVKKKTLSCYPGAQQKKMQYMALPHHPRGAGACVQVFSCLRL